MAVSPVIPTVSRFSAFLLAVRFLPGRTIRLSGIPPPRGHLDDPQNLPRPITRLTTLLTSMPSISRRSAQETLRVPRVPRLPVPCTLLAPRSRRPRRRLDARPQRRSRASPVQGAVPRVLEAGKAVPRRGVPPRWPHGAQGPAAAPVWVRGAGVAAPAHRRPGRQPAGAPVKGSLPTVLPPAGVNPGSPASAPDPGGTFRPPCREATIPAPIPPPGAR